VVRVSSEARQERFASIAAQVTEPCRRYLARRTDAATADEVLSDVLLVCWSRIDEVPDDALPWAYGVTRRVLANAERSARRQRRVAAKIAALDPPCPVEGTTPAEQAAAEEVRAALDALPARDAELLRLWAWEDLAPAEIAVVLGISPNAVSLRLRRAKDKLGERLRQIGGPAGQEWSTTPRRSRP